MLNILYLGAFSRNLVNYPRFTSLMKNDSLPEVSLSKTETLLSSSSSRALSK